MKQFSKTVCVLFVASIFLVAFGIFAACSSSGDDDNEPQTISKGALVTGGGISAAETVNGTLTATLTAANGTYRFTENTGASTSIIARAAVDNSKNGTWTFTKTNESVFAYAGTYKGDISKFTTDEVALTLTVNKVQNDGKLTDVTSEKEFPFTADTTTFSATIPSVEVEKQSGESQEHSGDDAYSEIKGVSAHIEIYDGQTLDETIFYEFEGSDEAKSSKDIGNFVERGTYGYTYDRDKKLIRLNLKSYSVVQKSSGEGVDYANADEAVRVYEKFSGTPSEAQKALITAKAVAAFNTTELYKFIRNSENSFTLVPYFEGAFPTAIRFAPDIANGNATNLTLRNGGIQFTAYSANNEVAYTYEVYPTFNRETETFSGTLYRTVDGNVESMGTIAGEYHSSAKGMVGSTIGIQFTTIPTGVNQISTQTYYAFRQVYVIGVGNNEPEVTDDDDSVAGKLYYAPVEISAEYKSASQYNASVAFSTYSFALGDDTLIINAIESARRQGYDNEVGVITKDNARSQDTFNYTQDDTMITLTKDPRTITVYASELQLDDPNSGRKIPLYRLDADKVFAWSEATVSESDQTAHAEIVYFTLTNDGNNEDGDEVGHGVYVYASTDTDGEKRVQFNYTISDNTFRAIADGEIIGTGDVTSHDEYTFYETTHMYQNML